MLTYEASVSIGASCATVWRILCDVARWPEWLPTIARVEPLDGKPLRPGARFVVHQPRLRPATWTVSHLDEPRSFVWGARTFGCGMVAEHTVAPGPPGTSSVLLRFSFQGPLGVVVGALYRALATRYLAQEAAALKRKAEGAASFS